MLSYFIFFKLLRVMEWGIYNLGAEGNHDLETFWIRILCELQVLLTDGSLATLANMRHNLSVNNVKVEGMDQDNGCQQNALSSTRVRMRMVLLCSGTVVFLTAIALISLYISLCLIGGYCLYRWSVSNCCGRHSLIKNYTLWNLMLCKSILISFDFPSNSLFRTRACTLVLFPVGCGLLESRVLFSL
jgi:hypothetical protein